MNVLAVAGLLLTHPLLPLLLPLLPLPLPLLPLPLPKEGNYLDPACRHTHVGATGMLHVMAGKGKAQTETAGRGGHPHQDAGRTPTMMLMLGLVDPELRVQEQPLTPRGGSHPPNRLPRLFSQRCERKKSPPRDDARGSVS